MGWGRWRCKRLEREGGGALRARRVRCGGCDVLLEHMVSRLCLGSVTSFQRLVRTG